MDIRAKLGLPPDAPDEQVDQFLANLRSQALGNLAGPEGFQGVAQSHRAAVFVTYKRPADVRSVIEEIASGFEADEVEMVQVVRRPEGDFEVSVRVVTEQPRKPANKAARK